MVQMGFFAVAHQLRKMVALVPSLLIEGRFAEMTEADGSGPPKTPDKVTAVCTYGATLVSLAMAGIGIAAAPWVLTLIYGKAYGNASAAASIALATAMVHMGSGAASSRVSILSIRTSMGVNTTWALFVGAAATRFLFREADAAKGASVYLGAHIVTATLFLFFLRKWGNAPAGMISTYVIGAACSVVLAALSILRTGSAFPAPITVTMLCIWGLTTVALIRTGKRRRWLPSGLPSLRFGAKLIDAVRPRFA